MAAWDRLLVIENDTNSENSDTDTTESVDTGDDTDSEDARPNHHGPDSRTASHELYDKEKQRRLGKRLAYILRYGAEVAGLEVLHEGFVSLTDLLKTHLMRHDTIEEVLKEVKESHSSHGDMRFEKKEENGIIYVRACYGRRMERKPCHEGTQVTRLLEATINYVADHIKYFDLQEFPDEFLIKSIMHRLKLINRLNNVAFDSLLGRNIDTLDLSDAVLTVKTLKLLGQRCPHLKELSLKRCGYIVTDHTLEILLQRLKELESLDLESCSHLSDRTVNAIVKNCSNMVKLNIVGVPNISQQALLHLITACDKLKQLDISQCLNLTPEGWEILAQFTGEHHIMLNIIATKITLCD